MSIRGSDDETVLVNALPVQCFCQQQQTYTEQKRQHAYNAASILPSIPCTMAMYEATPTDFVCLCVCMCVCATIARKQS